MFGQVMATLALAAFVGLCVVTVLKGRGRFILIVVLGLPVLVLIGLLALGAAAFGDDAAELGVVFLLVGGVVLVLPVVGAVRLAQYSSWWAERFYDDEKRRRAHFRDRTQAKNK